MPASQQRVVIDTNIFISFLINGNFSKLNKIILEDKAILILSSELINELINRGIKSTKI